MQEINICGNLTGNRPQSATGHMRIVLRIIGNRNINRHLLEMIKKTLSIIGFVIILTGFCQSGFSQNLKDDPYAKICFKFSKDLNSEIETSELVKYFDDSQKTDSLKFKLSECRDEIKKNREKIEYYITKFDRPKLVFYNVNLYNPKEKLTFGDLRIVFKDKNDFLIDEWIYLKETDAIDNTEDNKLPPIPLPPLPK